MSPEQILGESVDPRSDVFSLGVVLYQLVCGARPFERGDETDRRPAAHRIRRDPPIPLHRRAPDVPLALERIVMRAIEKLPADRFQSAEAIAEQLEELVAARTGLRGDQPRRRCARARGARRAPRRRRRRSCRARASARRFGGPWRGSASSGALVVAAGSLSRRRRAARAARRGRSRSSSSRLLRATYVSSRRRGPKSGSTASASTSRRSPRGIPLPPGTHYVTLVHPSAARREAHSRHRFRARRRRSTS